MFGNTIPSAPGLPKFRLPHISRTTYELQHAEGLYVRHINEIRWELSPLQNGLTKLVNATTAQTPKRFFEGKYDRIFTSDDAVNYIGYFQATVEGILINQVLRQFRDDQHNPYLTLLTQHTLKKLLGANSGSPQNKYLIDIIESAKTLGKAYDIDFSTNKIVLCLHVLSQKICKLADSNFIDQMHAVCQHPWLIDIFIDGCLGPINTKVAKHAQSWKTFQDEAPTFEKFINQLNGMHLEGLTPLDPTHQYELQRLRSLYPNIPSILRGYVLEPNAILPVTYETALGTTPDKDTLGWYCKFPIFVIRRPSDDDLNYMIPTLRHEAIHSLVNINRLSHLLSELRIQNANLNKLFHEGITELLARHADEILNNTMTQANAATPQVLMTTRDNLNFDDTLSDVRQMPSSITYNIATTLAIGLARQLGFYRFMRLFTAAHGQDAYNLSPSEITILQPIFRNLGNLINAAVSNSSDATDVDIDTARKLFQHLQSQ